MTAGRLPPICHQELRRIKPYLPPTWPSPCRTCGAKMMREYILWRVATYRQWPAEAERNEVPKGNMEYYCDKHLPKKWRDQANEISAKLAEREAQDA